MDTSKIIRGVVSSGRYTVTAPIVKEDYGLYLKIEGVELPSTYEVDFSNSESNGTSVTMIGNSDGVLIPRQFIDSGKDVFAFLYHVGADYGRTVYKFRIPNKVRPDRTDETPTPEEQSVIDQAIGALNEAVAQTAQDVISAGQAAQSAQGYAQSASASAQSASQYASSAQTSANTASAKAQDASGYAQTASTKASEASQSASTASAKATESAQSATNAQGYAQTAEQAKTASQTAQGLAEGARDSAISAKNDAESARDDAESARDEAVQAVESISGALDDKADVITDTASGAIASFPDGADDLPLKNLIVDINPIQDLSHGDPSPENICPISGWTGVTVQRTGKNLFDTRNYASNRWNIFGIPNTLKPNTTYTFSIHGSTAANWSLWLNNSQTMASTTTMLSPYISTGSHFTFATPSNMEEKWLLIGANGVQSENILINDVLPQLELASTATSYEPYTGRSITIDLGQTVYGGHFDVVSGELVIDRAMVDLGTLNWSYSAESLNHRFSAIMPSDYLVPSSASDRANVVCSRYASNPSVVASTSALGISGYQGSTTIFVRDLAYSDKNSFKSAVNGEQLVYRLATPIEIQLSANQVNSLLGVNNLWADSGDTEVEYRANTKLYINRLTEPDADMIADANITSGSYFMVGNSLFKATANIASGSAVIVGTNAIRKSLSEALNEINA